MKCDSNAPCKPSIFQRKILSLQDMVRNRSPCWMPSHVGTMSLDSTGMVPSPAQEKKKSVKSQIFNKSKPHQQLHKKLSSMHRHGVTSGVSLSPGSGNILVSHERGNSVLITDESFFTWLKQNEIVLDREVRDIKALQQTSAVLLLAWQSNRQSAEEEGTPFNAPIPFTHPLLFLNASNPTTAPHREG